MWIPTYPGMMEDIPMDITLTVVLILAFWAFVMWRSHG